MPSHNGTLNGSWPESFGFTIHGDGPTYVIGVKRSGLAHPAGVSPGDQVLELDGHDVSDMSAEAIKKLAYHSRNIPPTIGKSYISLSTTSFYRSQRSCGKIMFTQTSVILFTGGLYPSMHWADTPWQTPPWVDTPWANPPLADTPPLGRHCLGRHPPWQTPPLGRHPLGRHPPGQTSPARQTPPWADIPPMATAADGTHPTGMHSCCGY